MSIRMYNSCVFHDESDPYALLGWVGWVYAKSKKSTIANRKRNRNV